MVNLPDRPADYTEANKRVYYDRLNSRRTELGRWQAGLVVRKDLGEDIDEGILEDNRRDVWKFEAEALRVNPDADSIDEDGPRP